MNIFILIHIFEVLGFLELTKIPTWRQVECSPFHTLLVRRPPVKQGAHERNLSQHTLKQNKRR